MTGERRFWAGAAGFLLLVCALTGLVVLHGNTVGVPVTGSPGAGETVSGRSRVVLRFGTTMRRESVEGRLTVLLVDGNGAGAAVPGSWAWTEGGSRSERVAQFVPAAPLVPGATYRATLRAGAQAANGRTVPEDRAWAFTVRQPRLLFLRPDATGRAQVWQANADGAEARQVTRAAGGVREFSAAPDGERVAYVASEGAQMTALWVIRADGTGEGRLSPAGDIFGYASPAWSPAGDVIVYVLRAAVPGATPGSLALGAAKLWAVTPAARRLGRVYGRGDEVGFAPVWSPDGTRLAFREQVDAGNNSAVVISNFGATTPVAAGPGSRIAWSPDGSRLAFDETTPDAGGAVQSRITVVRADGTDARPLFGDAAGTEAAPDWSPDGSRLAYIRRAQAADGSPVVEVWTAGADGAGARRLLGGDGLTSAEPAWSPDGRALVATRFNPRTGNDRGIWRVGADGAGARLLVAGGERAVWVP